VLASRAIRSALQQFSAFALIIAAQQLHQTAHQGERFVAAVDFDVQHECIDVERDVQHARICTLEEDSLRCTKLMRDISSRNGEQLALIRILTNQLARAKSEITLTEAGNLHLKAEVAAALVSTDSLLLALS
jgi:hypothetical protein